MGGRRSRWTGIATATGAVVVVTGISRVAGLVREVVVAAVFGATAAVDAYLVALSVPNVVIGLLSTAVVTAMVPTLSRALGAAELERASRTFSVVSTAVLTMVILASGLLFVSAPLVVDVLAPGFDSPTRALAAELTRILLAATVFVVAMNLLSTLLQAGGRFVLPATVGIPFNVVMVGAAVWFGRRYGVRALAVGFVVASLVRVLVQLPGLTGLGVRLRPSLDRAGSDARAVAGLVPTVLFSHVVSNVNATVDRMVGSTLPAGTIAALGYANRLVTLPQGLLADALLQVIYPSLAGRHERDGPSAFADLLARGLRMTAVVLAPIAAGAIALAEPAVRVVYARGSFDAGDVELTTLAVAGYAAGIVFVGLRNVVMRAMYVLADRRGPVGMAVVGMVLNVVGDVTLGRLIGIAGLAAATSASYLGALLVGLRRLADEHGVIAVRPLAGSLARIVLAAAVSGTVAWVTADLVAPGGGGLLVALGALVAAGTAGSAVYVALLALLRVPELGELSRLGRRLLATPRRRRGGRGR